MKSARPNSISNPAWAEKNLGPELDKTPEAREALFDSILALWRLSVVGSKCSEDVNWQKLVSAWLVCVHHPTIVAEIDGTTML
jgi:hypothetical protein